MADENTIEANASNTTEVNVPNETEDVIDLVEAQRNFYEEFGHPGRIIYDLYPTKSTLERKLRMLFTDEKKSEKVSALAEVIWAQRFFVGKTNAFGIRLAPIFVFCIYDNFNMRKKISHPLEMKSNKFSLHPVFRVQKCTADLSDERGCCAMFIDELGRVYKDWQDFVENNKFDDCVMLTPKNGLYMGDTRHNDVELDVFLRKSGITQALDAGSAILSVGAAGVSLVAIIPAITVAPAVVVGATITGLSCAAYSGIRSIYNLYDRSSHEQSIGIEDNESRAAWLNIGTSAFLVTTVGMARGLSKLVKMGKDIPRIVTGTVKGAQIGTFTMQTVGCADGTYSFCKRLFDGEDITILEVAQLGTAIFLWTHSARNLGLAENTMKVSGTKNTMTTKRFMLTVQKTAQNTLLNQRTMLNALRQVDGSALVREIQAVFSFSSSESNEMKYVASGVPAIVKIEYCRLFDTRIEQIVHKLDMHYTHTKLIGLKNLLIRFMCNVYNMTLRGIEHFVDYVHQIAVNLLHNIGDEMENFNIVLKMIHNHVKKLVRMKLSPMSYDDYMIGLCNRDRQVRQFDDEIRALIAEHANAHARPEPKEEDETEDDMSDDKKIALALEDRVDELMDLFADFGIGDRKTELQEAITGILKTLTPKSAETFFLHIVMRLIAAHADDITNALNHSIPVDSYINTIYCMLDMREESKRIEAVLTAYTEDNYAEIAKEFADIYTPVTNADKIIDCKKCSGKKCTK